MFNLTGYVLSSGSTSSPSIQPGVQATAIGILTTNGIAGYAAEEPISVTGRSASINPFISISPSEVDFPGIVLESAAAAEGSSDTFIISNTGQNQMTILGYAFTNGSVEPNSDNPTTWTNVTTTNGISVLDINEYFMASNLPAVGTIIPGGDSITVNALFNTTVRPKIP